MPRRGSLTGQDEHPATVFESESLLVQVASAEYLCTCLPLHLLSLHLP